MSDTLSTALEREHRLIDEGIETFVAGAGEVTDAQRAQLLRAVELLRHHIYLEEEFLFPPLRDAGLVGPVMVMVHEHGQMWPILDLLEQLLSADDVGMAAPLCRDLLRQLTDHNMKEERILYPQADALLPADELAELVGLVSSAALPTDWVCAGAATTS